MNILMVADFYWPFLGGVEQHVRTLSYELVERGHSVTVATIRTEGLPEREHDGGVEVRRIRTGTQRLSGLFDQTRPWAPPLTDPIARQALNAVIRDVAPDIVHGHDWLARSLFPITRSTPPLVMTAHYYTNTCAKKDLLNDGRHCSGPGIAKCFSCSGRHYGRMKGPAVALANVIGNRIERRGVHRYMAVSRATAIGNGLDDAGCVIVPNIVPTELSRYSGDLITQLPGDDFFVYVGDLRATKGYQVLLDAYAGLVSDRPLVVIGKRWATSPRDMPSGVHVFEDWPNEAVLAAFGSARAAIVPSVWAEPFGLVAIEALAQGCPVVASATGGLTDIIEHDVNGLLVAAGSVSDLANALGRIDGDDELVARLASEAPASVERFRAGSVVPDIVSIYTAALREAPPSEQVGLEIR